MLRVLLLLLIFNTCTYCVMPVKPTFKICDQCLLVMFSGTAVGPRLAVGEPPNVTDILLQMPWKKKKWSPVNLNVKKW